MVQKQQWEVIVFILLIWFSLQVRSDSADCHLAPNRSSPSALGLAVLFAGSGIGGSGIFCLWISAPGSLISLNSVTAEPGTGLAELC